MAKHSKTIRETAAEYRDRQAKTKILRILVMIVAITVAFSLGFITRGNTTFMEKLGVISTATTEQNPGMTVTGNTKDSISARIAEIEGIINTQSFNTYDLDACTQSMIDVMVSSTKDKYFMYFSPQRYSAYLKDASTTSTDYGIGVLLGENNGQAYVVDVFENSPAQKCGVKEGDVVVAINGDRSHKWTEAEATRALSSENNKKIWVTWYRPVNKEYNGGDEFTTELTCTNATTENVTASLDGTVGHISIKQITKNASNLVSESVKNLEGQGAKSFVLDLRNCPGGYLSQAVEVANLFMKSGTIVQIKTPQGTTSKSVTNTSVTEKPIVLLVNENTASSAEVIAAALQGTGTVQVVGQQTMGKGSVQNVQDLSFGGALRYTVAYYLTPKGQPIEGNGIEPSISVANAGNRDYQYIVARDTAKSL